MNLRRELIALAVRILASETDLVRKPEQSEVFWTSLLGLESYDQRIAQNVEATLDAATDLAKRAKTNREFKKIVRNY